MHYEPNYAYPVVVWLHSDGGDEKQLLRVMPHISMRNYVGVGVRASHPCEGRRGFQWQQSPHAFCLPKTACRKRLPPRKRNSTLTTDRIFLAGHEAGGTMAYRLALRSPQNFAGALSAGGRFPLGQMPLMNLHSLRDLPLFLAYCRDSETYRQRRPLRRVAAVSCRRPQGRHPPISLRRRVDHANARRHGRLDDGARHRRPRLHRRIRRRQPRPVELVCWKVACTLRVQACPLTE